MSEFVKDTVKLALDMHSGTVEKYTANQSKEALHEALVQANGGSTTLDYRRIRDGKCSELFEIIETILDRTVVEGLMESDYFNNLVEFHNVRAGDKNEFVIEGVDSFYVAEISDGNQAIRRQRLVGPETITVNTKLKAVRIYEELSRILAGNVDFDRMIRLVTRSFQQDILNETYALWADASQNDFGGSAYYNNAGSYVEANLLNLIEHVEAAANGKTAKILGTKKALRNLSPNVSPTLISDIAKNDLYNDGYIGRFYGSPCIALPQRHQVGSTNFVLDDDVLIVVAGEDKPIKMVYEGDPLVIFRDPTVNMDLTQEYFYSNKFGAKLVLAANGGIGRYDL